MNLRRAVVLAGLVLILALVNWSIMQKEALMRDGTLLLIELAPVDPRSLIQGDYMRLDTASRATSPDQATSGRVRARLSSPPVRIGRALRAAPRRQHPLAAGEHLLVYRRRGGQIRLGTDAFFFQEGHAARYERAKFGELRVGASGESVLIGLRDEQRRPLGAEPNQP